MKTTTLQQQRKRKALLVLPLVVFAFMTLLFKTLGGGGASAADGNAKLLTGFNTHLPDARLKEEKGLNKLSFYDRAAADSTKLKQAAQTDPYAKKQTDSIAPQSGLSNSIFPPHQSGFSGLGVLNNDIDPAGKEVLLNKRLAELQAAINKPTPTALTKNGGLLNSTNEPQERSTAKLSIPMAAEDPELKQMNGLLEKILDIQHPERVREKATAVAPANSNEQFKAIPAVIDGNQKIVQGTVIRMKLLDSMRINGQLFPKGQLIYGSGDLYNQRVKINIKLIHVGLNIIPVDITVFDYTDGMEGISVPEAVTGDALKEGAVGGVQTMDVMSMDPSVTAQLATAGINTAKGLFSKKIKRVKGRLKNGHELLLRDNLLLKQQH